MRKLIAGTFLTIDGIMQAPGGPEEDPSGGFAHGGWSVPYFNDRMGEAMVDWISRAGGFLLGRKTYEIFAAHWPHVGNDPIADRLNNSPKYVASRTLAGADWKHSSIIKGDLIETVRRLKEESGGEIQIHGSGNLIQSLLPHNLIDEFRLWISPVVLGTGKRLFGEGTVPARFELVDTQLAGSGAVLHVYRAAGTLNYGSFALEQPTPEEIERRTRIRG